MPLMGMAYDDGTTYCGFGTGYGTSSMVFAYLSKTSYVNETTSGFFVSGERRTYAMTVDPSNVYFYKDGTQIAGSPVGGIPAAPSSGSLCAAGGYLESPNHSWQGTNELTAYWARALSKAEIAEVTRNPWQLFAPIRQPVFYSLPSGGGGSPTANRIMLLRRPGLSRVWR